MAFSPVPELNRLRNLQKRLGFEGCADGSGRARSQVRRLAAPFPEARRRVKA